MSVRAIVLAHERRGVRAYTETRGRRVPCSLMLAAGATAVGLDDAAQAVAEIARAVRTGEIRAGPPPRG